MRNYIILNNKNSNTISGLIIQELAPISKPLQRTQVETIDGRDGDIVTPLGYAAYNKKIKIGLYGNFDINEVIAYFATKGTVIFSNEPDKYYYYQIVDQIDYERLVRYRVATVTMHVQPFKYSATEGTITVDSSDTVSGEGSDIALDGTAEAPFNTLRHKGNATQKTTSGKNLLGLTDGTYSSSGITATVLGGKITLAGTATANSFVSIPLVAHITPTQAWSISLNNTAYGDSATEARLVDTDGNFINVPTISANAKKENVTTYKEYLRLMVRTSSGVSANGVTLRPQVEIGAATDYEPYTAGASPNPDYPQDIQVVTGDSTVKITGKNIASLETSEAKTAGGLPFTIENGIIHIDGTMVSSGNFYFDPFKVGSGAALYWIEVNGYTDATSNSAMLLQESTDGGSSWSTTYNLRFASSQEKQAAVTLDSKKLYRFRWYCQSTNKYTNATIKVQLEYGSTKSLFEPYIAQSYVIPFGDTYLAKIGDYADEPVKVDGTWYIRRAIGKVVLDGSEGWGFVASSPSVFYTDNTFQDYATSNNIPLSDHFMGANNVSGNAAARNLADNTMAFIELTTPYRLYIRATKFNSVSSDFETWLNSNPTTVYYALATPTDEAITDQDLIDALDELYDQAHSYKGHTHITATAADGNAPAVLSVEVGEDNESTVTNAGNTTSRPILTIYGQGDIGVYINDVEVLDVALGDEEYITLDSVEMEAYKDTTANLKNRLVTGDYSKLALNAGDNKIRFTGTVTKYEISKYSRWL